MAEAVVLKSGFAVRLQTENYQININDVTWSFTDGMVSSFKHEGTLYRYCYFVDSDYVTSSERMSQYFDGYYNYEDFSLYRVKKLLPKDVRKFTFDFEKKDKALLNDTIFTVNCTLIFEFPNIIAIGYSFLHDGVTRYKDKVIIPDDSESNILWDAASLPVGPAGYLFNNIALVELEHSLHPQSNLPSIFLGVILEMRRIVYDIFIFFTYHEQFTVLIIQAYWENLQHVYSVDDYDSIMNASHQLTDLYNALAEFSSSFYANKTAIIEETGNNFILFLVELAKVAPPQSFEIFDPKTKYNVLCEIIKKSVAEHNRLENAVITIVQSVTDEQADSFLSWLIRDVEINAKDSSKNKTLFEILFRSLDDNRSERYTFGLLSTSNNRAIFIISVLKIWLKSIYNPYFNHSSYTLPPIDGIYEESYYMELETISGQAIPEPRYYNLENQVPIINYQAPAQTGEYTGSYKTKDFSIQFKNNKLEVYELISTYVQVHRANNDGYDKVTTKELYGVYELYQPITVIGYKPDLNLSQVFKGFELDVDIQECIPAFFLYYMVDYDDLATLDFSIMLAIEIGMNFIPGVGAIPALSKVRYLKYLSRLRSLETAASTDLVLHWAARQGITNTVEFIAGNALSINNYVAMTTNDIDQKEFSDKLNIFLGIVMVGSLCANLRNRSKLLESAHDVDTTLIRLNAENISIYKPGMTSLEMQALDDALLQVTEIAGNQNVAINKMIFRLTEFEDDGTNILFRYGGFTPRQKFAFAMEYGQDSLLNDLKNFNASDGSGMVNWKNLFDREIADRNVIDFVLSEKRTTAILRYYHESGLRNILEPLTYEKRLLLLDEMGEISDINFGKFVNNPDLINQWLRYNDDLLLRSEFKDLATTNNILFEDVIMSFIERYGNISKEGFVLIKYAPKQNINHLRNFTDAVHDISYFYNRRAEMLPPSFKNLGNGRLYGTQEVDSFIELELLYGGRARASLEGEAGDIIMNGGTLNGLSLDPLGLSHTSHIGWTHRFNRNLNQFKESIDIHFKKLNKIPPVNKIVIDYKYMNEISVALGHEPLHIQNIVDDYIESVWSQYNNSNYLIKLNH